ncbi:hypothetical protein NK983_29680, partial [Salmonella enterica subsp. enterica serovar Typhimurium]|nr:hypothetical protein [Salmonella enterica subsp. enterica serovar Typhimurium]
WYALVELAGSGDRISDRLEALLAACMASGTVRDAVIAQDGAQALALWSLRENISEAQRIEGFSVKHDISVPVGAIPQFLEVAGERLEA